MNKQDKNERKVAAWQQLTETNLHQKIPPCAVDILIAYEGNLSFEEHLNSEEFLFAVREKLKKFPCYKRHGVNIEALSLKEMTSLLPVFTWGLVGRLHLEMGTIQYFSDNELHSLFWQQVLHGISKFDPLRGKLETYLQFGAFRAVKKKVVNQIKRYEKMEAMEVLQGAWDSEILPSDALAIAKGIRLALRIVLVDEVERRLFEETVYSEKRFEEIAAEIKSNKATISLCMTSIRERLADELEKQFSDFGKRTEFQRFEVFASVFREYLSREDFRKIF